MVRFSGSALEYGQERHVLEGVPVRITSITKTVADCFKYRNKIGLDVALEGALRDCLRRKKATPSAICVKPPALTAALRRMDWLYLGGAGQCGKKPAKNVAASVRERLWIN